jgi:ubiquinone/menaquinone biosynthesis C-methylase UbiE
MAANPSSTGKATDAVGLQRAYYAQTAERYDAQHLGERGEHDLALGFMISMMDLLDVHSLLDIGSGTGRCLLEVAAKAPEVRALGIEPSAELREIGYAKGVPRTQLIDGDGGKLAFADGSFDMVCEYGALHHIPDPAKAVAEMLRVARKAIFISDVNNYGQGGRLARLVKQTLHGAGLWPLADWIKTRGKGYLISEGDGLYYSYSVFNNYRQIEEQCEAVHLLNTTAAGRNLYRSATHVALLGIKRL